MLEGESIVCFAPEPWHSMWRSRQQILARLARANKVLFVEPRPYLKSVMRSMARGQLRMGDLQRGGLLHVGEGLHVYRPPVYAPLSGKRTIEAVTGYLRVNALRRAMSSLGMQNPILWLERPDMWNEAGNYDEKLLIYRIVDEYRAYNDVGVEARLRIGQQEECLLRRADLVLVTSEALRIAKSIFNPHTYLLPHGVDYPAFAAATKDRWLPDEIRRLPRPIIGYSGLIAARLDLGLLASVAVTHPAWSLALVGEINPAGCETELVELGRLPNVHFLGRVDVGLVPHYVKAFDVGLIPYRLDEQSYNINPLKLLEYLACGKPVVSVDIPSVRPFANVVMIAASRASFVAALREALAETDGDAAGRRQATAADNTWESRVELFSELANMALERKSQEQQAIRTGGKVNA